ncbi:hypothetical protein N7499_006030 [Penicillium canescens]|uniref:Uncharacterized protein n=1 Tax=Penicillium canescens TaxID=5083 RepID=A0AAD6ICY7_PENCN|nr:uncharacterized protein N7446_001803 [Penicillium canescens]KAJ5997575.1 hypothetical protein N7522_009235 [Penicillium canescens]KAJ6043605.1 hypothetical protein N7460_004960 [Penicillium canescens]KAJ6055078.1 hypothetical protein N7444_004176 [Penicillium canescens]KAJ6074026.1 hypothetical protein N7446_001803 [Penicillium canescens]KAJ6081156.1 hypothetical protein N7499_006030 [Penicillium canescens]
MAIWPFGRKSKRHTIQLDGAEAADLQSAFAAEPTLGRKPSRHSKRPSNRTSAGEAADSRRSSALVPSNRPISSLDRPASLADHTTNPRERPPSRSASLLKRKPSQNGPNKLRRRLSKRKAHEIMREREIRMLSSTPIDIPHHSTDYGLEHRRRKANGRRADRYMSDISLSIRDSATSSTSDMSDPYTYKVNAFAALTPRPVVRYVEAPRLQTARSSNPPASSRQDRERLKAMTMSEEDLYYSKRRVNELADSLDAGALRELLDRDRRRREKKQMDDQEKLRRKLQERADAQQAADEQKVSEPEPQPEPEHTQPEPPVAEPQPTHDVIPEDIQEDTQEDNPSVEPAAAETGSWLRGASRASVHTGRDSLESSRVVGNIDDGSLRERRLIQRPSFAPSHDITMSRTTLSPSHSSLRQGLSSPSHSQTFGAGSTSDISKGVDSERRLSDTSGRRGNTITSLFRRGSSRIKRSYKERFQDTSPEVSNASHESFYKIQTQSSPPPPSIIPPRLLVPTNPIKRSQSKFTEHFGDEPLSPPDSRLQSPDIPEQVPESSLENQETSLRGPTPSAAVDIQNPKRRHHGSWTAESFDAESDNVPLSQSLASIDSEGSWMSGQFFRRMSQKPSSPVRTNLSSFGLTEEDGAEDDLEADSIDESRRFSSNVLGETEHQNEATPEASDLAETWHNEVGRRPVLVNPVVRPKSTQGMLRGVPSLSPISAEEDYIMEETSPTELHRVPSAKAEIGYAE